MKAMRILTAGGLMCAALLLLVCEPTENGNWLDVVFVTKSVAVVMGYAAYKVAKDFQTEKGGVI